MEIFFESYRAWSDIERRPSHQTGPGPEVQRRANVSDATALELLQQTSVVIDTLGAERCRHDVVQTRAYEPEDPNLPIDGSVRDAMGTAPFTRARLVGGLAAEIVLGLSSSRAACAHARMAAATYWGPRLAWVEQRDGIEAALQGPHASWRAQFERLVEIRIALTAIEQDLPLEERFEQADALRQEAVAILAAWAPDEPRVQTLRAHRMITTPSDNALYWLHHILRWAVDGVVAELMPAGSGLSPEARTLRSYFEALRSDPARAVSLEEGGLPVLEGYEVEYDVTQPVVSFACGDRAEPPEPERVASEPGDEPDGYDDFGAALHRPANPT